MNTYSLSDMLFLKSGMALASCRLENFSLKGGSIVTPNGNRYTARLTNTGWNVTW